MQEHPEIDKSENVCVDQDNLDYLFIYKTFFYLL